MVQDVRIIEEGVHPGDVIYNLVVGDGGYDEAEVTVITESDFMVSALLNDVLLCEWVLTFNTSSYSR